MMRRLTDMMWRLLCVALLVIVLPGAVYAQEASILGTITDATGAVLPGVSVTATHEATGNTFVAVTDAGGKYRLSVRIGSYTVTAELSGFSTVSQRGIEVQVGQEATFNLKLPLAGVQET